MLRRRCVPFSLTRTRWMLGLKRRFVLRCECDRLMPKLGFLPHISQTLAMGVSFQGVAAQGPQVT